MVSQTHNGRFEGEAPTDHHDIYWLKKPFNSIHCKKLRKHWPVAQWCINHYIRYGPDFRWWDVYLFYPRWLTARCPIPIYYHPEQFGFTITSRSTDRLVWWYSLDIPCRRHYTCVWLGQERTGTAVIITRRHSHRYSRQTIGPMDGQDSFLYPTTTSLLRGIWQRRWHTSTMRRPKCQLRVASS